METERFVVVENHNGKYEVEDTNNNQRVRFGFNVPPIYASLTKPAAEWGNYYAARGFCQRLAAKNKGA